MTLTSATHGGRLTQQQLEAVLWKAANALRGPVDPGDFKAYVFPVMFFKWISDNWDYQHAQAVADFGEDVPEEVEVDYQPFTVPERCHWADVYNTTFNVGAKLASTLQRIQQANPDLVGVFGDVNWANKERLPENALAALLGAFHEVTLDPDHVDGDMLGAAYEYLLREFAEASGRKAGEFFTPRHVVHLLVKILDPQPGESVSDPACGSGGMLVETVTALKAAGREWRNVRLSGQEINLTTAAIAKMNLYLHDIQDFKVVRGDTFRNPKLLTTRNELQTFDITIANPPFSLQNWGRDEWVKDPWHRPFCGLPPAKNGDFAWVQHMVTTMKQDTGRVGVVMPHGVLFRGGTEGQIRECLIRSNKLEAVIGLANNLFYSTSIPVCLLIFRANKPADRDDKVLFIDASKRFQAGTNQNTMSDDDVAVIDAAYKRGVDLDGEDGLQLRLVDVDEIAGNGFDLNIGRYITTAQDTEIDVEAALIEYREARERLRELEDVLDAKLKAAGFDA